MKLERYGISGTREGRERARLLVSDHDKASVFLRARSLESKVEVSLQAKPQKLGL